MPAEESKRLALVRVGERRAPADHQVIGAIASDGSLQLSHGIQDTCRSSAPSSTICMIRAWLSAGSCEGTPPPPCTLGQPHASPNTKNRSRAAGFFHCCP